jgi:acyl-CoA synthetase (AMP-forming)/AMP-acid ligase II
MRFMWLHSEVITLGDLPRYWAARAPGATALIDRLGRRSFAELDASSDRIAAAIVGEGLAAPCNIGFLGKNSARYFELLFGVVKAGCAMAPLNWRLAVSELVAVIEDAQCPVIFVDREFEPVIAAVASQSRHRFRPLLFDSAVQGRSSLGAWINDRASISGFPRVHPLDTAVLIYTSGTTGKPKGVELTHHAFDGMRLCEHLASAYEWRAGDVMLTAMPVFHLVGTGLSIQALYNGAAVSILPMLEPSEMLRVIARDRPSICALVPTAIQMLIDHPGVQKTDFSSLRLLMYAGAPITSVLLRRALALIGCQFMQFYGASESLGPLTLLTPDQHDPDNAQRLQSCGKPLPLIEFRICDPHGNDLPNGQIGEFWVRGPTIFRGYWRQPETAAEVLKEGWYRTGDAGFRDQEGYLYLVDRIKDMIVTGGENVYSAEVEQALAQHPAVHACAVIGLPDPKWGEKVSAVIVRRPEHTATAEEIIRHCRTLIAGYKVPKEVCFVQSLPMTSTGKVLKRAVRDHYRSLGVSPT